MITIVGSRDLWPTSDVVSAVAAAVGSTDGVRVRVSKKGAVSSPVELLALRLGMMTGKEVKTDWATSRGRAGVYHRDFHMVENSDRVLAFFATDAEMNGGTGHVVKAAMDRGVPVEAYALDETGSMYLLGSDDGNDERVRLSSRPDLLMDLMEDELSGSSTR